MTNSYYDQDTDRSANKSTGSKVPSPGLGSEIPSQGKTKSGPAGGLPGKSQRRSRNPGGDRTVGYVKSEGL